MPEQLNMSADAPSRSLEAVLRFHLPPKPTVAKDYQIGGRSTLYGWATTKMPENIDQLVCVQYNWGQ